MLAGYGMMRDGIRRLPHEIVFVLVSSAGCHDLAMVHRLMHAVRRMRKCRLAGEHGRGRVSLHRQRKRQ